MKLSGGRAIPPRVRESRDTAKGFHEEEGEVGGSGEEEEEVETEGAPGRVPSSGRRPGMHD